jgi:hypothetical protein
MLQKAIMLGILVRFGVALWNGYWGPSYGAEADAAGFHANAVAYAAHPSLDEFVIGHIYSYGLGLVYYLLTDSLFLGGLLSIIAWALSAHLFARLMTLLGLSADRQWRAMLIYALLPSSLLLTSITLREAYQMLFVNQLLCALLAIYLRRSALNWASVAIGLAGMGVLHGALLASGFMVLSAAFVLFATRSGRGVSIVQLAFFVLPVALLVNFGFNLFTSVAYNLDYGLGEAVLTYQEGTMAADGRAIYRSDLNLSGVGDLLWLIPIFLLQYMFEPMPWRPLALVDSVSIVENGLRALMLWRAIAFLRTAPEGHQRRMVIFVLLALLIIETVWSLGVSNWGTGLRHHLPSLGLLLAVGFVRPQQVFSKRAS